MLLNPIGGMSLDPIVSASADRVDRGTATEGGSGNAGNGEEAGATPNIGGRLLHSFVSASVDRGTAMDPSGTAGAAPLPRIDATLPDGARLHTPHVRGSGGVEN